MTLLIVHDEYRMEVSSKLINVFSLEVCKTVDCATYVVPISKIAKKKSTMTDHFHIAGYLLRILLEN